MVRRRSTVRFRKGARRSEPFFDSEPVTLLGGLTAEGTGQRFGYLREPWPSAGSRGLWVPSGEVSGRPGGHFGGQDRRSVRFKAECWGPASLKPLGADVLASSDAGALGGEGRRPSLGRS